MNANKTEQGVVDHHGTNNASLAATLLPILLLERVLSFFFTTGMQSPAVDLPQ